ncbi:MAG: helix-turn-helix transcriptional regulator [Myxococcales bacterium]|nr:helix-turn-helix transcriptional regulator [Myxococcales bacterium]
MNVRLFVLGLLREGPQHGYQLRRALEQSRASVWAEVLPGSIYHALRTLERDGFITLQGVEADGDRQRSIYALSRAGEVELRRLAEEAWDAAPNPYPTRLYAALAFSHLLSAATRAEKIAGARARLDAEIKSWEAALRRKGPHLSATTRLSFSNAIKHLRLDRALLDAIAAEAG